MMRGEAGCALTITAILLGVALVASNCAHWWRAEGNVESAEEMSITWIVENEWPSRNRSVQYLARLFDGSWRDREDENAR